MEVLADEGIRRGEMSREPTEVDALPAGTLLNNRYEILKLLAVGGMSEVYEANDTTLSRHVVIKILKKESLKNSWVVKKFIQGGRALTKIAHNCVEQILDLGNLPSGEQYLVVEYVKGVPLREMIEGYAKNRRQLPFVEVAEIMKLAGRGANAIHEAGFVHRDLKPENIMVHREVGTGELKVKVIDLGIVLELGATTDSAQSPGTLLYMAPEQLSRKEIMPASDVYALGEIAYEMLTGRHPFNPEDIAHLLELKRSEVKIKPLALRPGLPTEAEGVILKALSINASRRQQSAQEFGDELARALTPRPTTTLRFNRWWVVVAVAVLAVILGVSLWHQLSKRDTVGTTSPTPTPTQGEERTLVYGLTIVRQRDGKTIQATGRETFDTGDVFRFDVTPTSDGALYLLNEGTSQNWHVLFPTSENNKGVSQLPAFQRIETKGAKFTNRSGKEKGTEKIWMVWASRPIQPLEEIVRQSFGTDLTVSDPSQQDTLRRFMAEHSAATPAVITNQDRPQVTLKGRGELLVHLINLEHSDWK
jgi:serine/threonine protein kinase